MAGLSDKLAASLFAYVSDKEEYDSLYKQFTDFFNKRIINPSLEMPEELTNFIKSIAEEDRHDFLRGLGAGSKKDFVEVRVISAVELSPEQLFTLEQKLIRVLKKQILFKFEIEPDIIGGLRIIADNTVIDNSIKTQIHNIKEQIYRRVYSI